MSDQLRAEFERKIVSNGVILSNGTKVITIRVPTEQVELVIDWAEKSSLKYHDVTLEPPIDGLRDLSFLTYSN